MRTDGLDTYDDVLPDAFLESPSSGAGAGASA